MLPSFLNLGLLASGVAAHGAVTSYIINGKTYPGYVPPTQTSLQHSIL